MQDAPLLISDILRHGQQVHGDSTVITVEAGGHRTATFAEVATRAEKLAAALTRLGHRAGRPRRHVLLEQPGPPRGLPRHPLHGGRAAHPQHPAPRRAAGLRRSTTPRTAFIIVDASLIPLLAAIKDELKTVETIIVAGEGDTSPLGETLSYERLLAAEEPGFEWPELDERSAAAMCYTSGTTGNPKGVVYSHRSTWLHTMAEQAASSVGMTEKDRILIIVPMFHANAWGTPYGAWMAGTDMIMPQMFLMGEHLAAVINEHHPTLACGVPTIWNGLLALDTPIDFSTVRAITAGGAAVPAVAHRGVRGALRRHHHPGLGHDRDEPAGRLRAAARPQARRPRRHVLQDQGRPRRRRGRGARRRRGRDRAAQRRHVGGGVRDPRPVDHRLVLQGRGPGEVPRRLAAHGRRRHARRPGLHDDLGPHQGRDQVRRRVDLLGRARERRHGPPRRLRGRRDRHPRPEVVRAPAGGRRAEARDARRPRPTCWPSWPTGSPAGGCPTSGPSSTRCPRRASGKFDKKVMRAAYADGDYEVQSTPLPK